MIRRQIARWLVVGLITNAVLYLAYLILTLRLLQPKSAMTVVYVVGVIIGFVGHRSWSFEHSGRADAALLRYAGAYVIGYLVNLAGLELGVSFLGLPHQLVQAAMILIVAVMMFVMQKYFVFSKPGSPESVSPENGR
jgi:putative flippase GtrA